MTTIVLAYTFGALSTIYASAVWAQDSAPTPGFTFLADGQEIEARLPDGRLPIVADYAFASSIAGPCNIAWLETACTEK